MRKTDFSPKFDVFTTDFPYLLRRGVLIYTKSHKMIMQKSVKFKEIDTVVWDVNSWYSSFKNWPLWHWFYYLWSTIRPYQASTTNFHTSNHPQIITTKTFVISSSAKVNDLSFTLLTSRFMRTKAKTVVGQRL